MRHTRLASTLPARLRQTRSGAIHSLPRMQPHETFANLKIPDTLNLGVPATQALFVGRAVVDDVLPPPKSF